MGQLVHQDQPGATSQSGIEVELAYRHATIGRLKRRQNFQSFKEGLRFGPSVQLDVSDNDIDPFRVLALSGFEHGVGFAYTGGVAEEYLQLAPLLTSLVGLNAG